MKRLLRGPRRARSPSSRSRMARATGLKPRGLVLFDSYHCSRYNTNTGTLTEAMFRDVFAAIRAELARA